MSTLQEPPVIGPELAGTLMTAEEFDAAEAWDELYRYELISRVLIVTPSPSEGERGPNQLLGYLLQDYKERHPLGAALDYTLYEHTVAIGENRRRADRAIWAGLRRLPDFRRDVPTIVVEFVSAGRRNRLRDYETKRAEYFSAGVQEYWIIDRFARSMTVLRATGAGEWVVPDGETYRTELLPGFELAVGRLFAEADLVS